MYPAKIGKLGLDESASAAATPVEVKNIQVVIKCVICLMDDFPLELTSTTTCLHIRMLIEKRTGIPAHLQALVFNKKRLQDDSQTVSEAGISDASCLTMLVMEAYDQVREPGQEYTISLLKASGQSLGVDVAQNEDGDGLAVEDIVPGCLVAEWNASNPDRVVHVGDEIVDVNGTRGNRTKLVAEIQKNGAMSISLLAHPGLNSSEPRHRGTPAVANSEPESFGSPGLMTSVVPSVIGAQSVIGESACPSAECMAAAFRSPSNSGYTRMLDQPSVIEKGTRNETASPSQVCVGPECPSQDGDSRNYFEYTIMLDKTQGKSLGVDVEGVDGALKVMLVEGKGLVQDWNMAHPWQTVKPGHRIVEVNGVQDLAKLIDECKKNCVLIATLLYMDDSSDGSSVEELQELL